MVFMGRMTPREREICSGSKPQLWGRVLSRNNKMPKRAGKNKGKGKGSALG